MRDGDTIPSVTGDVDVSELRWLYPHEHLLVSWNQWRGETLASYPGNSEYARRQITAMLIELKALGVDALNDATPMGIGLDEAYVQFARDVSSASGVRVFLSTGLYATGHWPPWAHEWSAEQTATSSPAICRPASATPGFALATRAAVGTEITANEASACAIAHRIPARPCRYTHRLPAEIVDLLTGQGSRIYIAHVDMNTSARSSCGWPSMVYANELGLHHMDQTGPAPGEAAHRGRAPGQDTREHRLRHVHRDPPVRGPVTDNPTDILCLPIPECCLPAPRPDR